MRELLGKDGTLSLIILRIIPIISLIISLASNSIVIAISKRFSWLDEFVLVLLVQYSMAWSSIVYRSYAFLLYPLF